MTRTLPAPLNPSLIRLLFAAAIMAALSPMAHASYTVMDDDLYPASYIQSRDTQQARIEQTQQSIEFPRQRAALTRSASTSLEAILPSMMDGVAIRIIGRPDAMARKEGPLSNLAADRATAIRDYLVRKGIPLAAIKLEIDESPNPQRNGSMYPSEIHISTVAPAKTDYTQPPPARYALQHAPQYEAPIVAPVTNSRIAAPPPNPELIRFINASVQKGEMSVSVALQLLERLTPTLAPAPPPIQPQNPTWEILADDQTLQNTFARWGKLANWEIKWIGIPDIKNPGHVALPPGDFLATANHVLAQAQRAAKAAGIDISITAYPNRVLVISKEN